MQGVSFRCVRRPRGRRLGLAGWVRNEPDGSVAAHLEGPDDAVEEMRGLVPAGPPAARVEDVEVTEVEPTGASSFEIAD